MKLKFSITFRFLGIMLLILVLVSAVGLITYRQLAKVLDNAEESGKPDPVMITAKNLIFSLTQAENNVKTFTLTQDSIFVQKYEAATKKIRVNLQKLDLEVNKTSVNAVPFDTLSAMVHEKLTIYDSLLVLQNEYRVHQALQKVTQSIENVAEEVPVEQDEKWHLFKRKKDQKIITETIVDYNKVKSNLKQIQSSETSREEQQLRKEFALLQKDKSLSDKIQRIISKVESEGQKRDAQRAQETESIVRSANIQIILFCVLISILLIVTSYIIIRYITRSNRYRKVLKRAKNEAESLAQAKEHFVATVSHEIRTPMNIISGFADQLSNSELNQQQRDQLQTLIKASSHLLKLINEVLDFTKLQNYKLKLEAIPFELRSVLQEVQDLMTPLADAKGIEFELYTSPKVPEVIVGDPIRLSQILINITSNAIKFTHEGMVSVSVNSIDVTATHAVIEFSVTDTGIGMSSDKISRVFEAFEQAEVSTTRTYGGTGLGLSITKKLIELHEGEVSVHSSEGVGTEIIVQLSFPLGTKATLEDENATPLESIDFEPYTILVADDEPFNRKLLVTILNKYNATYTEVTNGREAIAAAEREHFDLILMDARMPEIDGLSASKEVRRTAKNAHTPIIALSAAVTEEDIKEYMDAGMTAFVPKPFKERTLIKKMHELLQQKEITESLEEPSEITSEAAHESLDFEALKSLSNGDTQFYSEMLETFISGTEEGMETINTAFKVSDLKTMQEIAHKISAPCKHLEATQLYDLLKAIETYDGEVTAPELTVLTQRVTTEGIRVIEQVKQEITQFKAL